MAGHSPVTAPPLVDGVVHVWTSLHDGPAPLVDESFSVAERDRVARFVHDHDRQRYVWSHWFVRRVLAGYVGCAPAELAFTLGPHGKPGLRPSDGRRPTVEFNMSHSGPLTLVVCTSSTPVGVDVEAVHPFPEWRAVAARVFSSVERAAVEAAPVAEQASTFLRHWTRKEAVVKALGLGLTDEMSTIDNGPFTIIEFVPADGYAAAIAVRGACTSIEHFEDPPE